MKKILIYYNFSYPVGGGAYLPFSFIEELQNSNEIIFAVDSEKGFEQSAELFDFHMEQSKTRIVQVMPEGYTVSKHNWFHSLYRFRHLRQLARNADVCISTNNVIDFGRPAHYFITVVDFGDQAFSARIRQEKMSFFQKTYRFLNESVLRQIVGMRSKSTIIHDPREHIYPNSIYVERLMKDHYGAFNSTVFYPPCTFEVPRADIPRDPFRVLYLGRIHPKKRIVDMIEIIERARAMSGKPLTFQIAGHLKQNPYTEKLQKIASEKKWVQLVGPVYGKEKADFLLGGTYAIHAERDETFGISITEYLKAGCIAIVPDEGGTVEIVNSPALTYHTNEDATRILTRLLDDGMFRQEQLVHCMERAKDFSFDKYLETQHRILDSILKGNQ